MSEQIREDLSGVLAGTVRSDAGTLAQYASDSSLHQAVPLAVVFPRQTDDVIATVRYAADHRIPVIARGAGTGLAGSGLGTGIVIDFAAHMNRILEVNDTTVRVEPGVVLESLNQELAKTGRHFAPDPSNEAVTTIGGMIGVDAAGSRAMRVGSTRDHLKKMQIVLADGTAHWLGDEPISAGLAARPAIAETSAESHDDYARVRVILRRLAAILNENSELIRQYQPLLLRNTAGYMLRGLLKNGYLNVPRLLAGAEGTLGICTEIVLHTSPLPRQRTVLLLLCSRFDEATQALPGILEFEPAACDLLDRRLLTLARESSPEYEAMIPPYAEAALMLEFVAAEHTLLNQQYDLFEQFVSTQMNGAKIAVRTKTEAEAVNLWRLPRQVVPLLARIQGKARPVPLIEDVVVPPESLGEFLHQAQRVLQRFQVTASLYAHAGSGQLHLRPFLEMPTPESKSSYEALARDLYRVVQQHGGSISGEHGDGFSRTAFLRTQYGPLYRVFQQIKQLFDPQGIFNPNKIVSSDPHLTIRHLRPDAELVELQALPDQQLQWTPVEIAHTAGNCNGCGQCKATPQAGRMCPFFRINRTEAASPRAQANTVRQYLISQFEATAEQPGVPLAEMTVAETLDSCFNCKQCQIECPSQVDIPHLWLEAKAADVQQNGLDRGDWILSRIETFGRLIWRFSWLINLAFRSRMGRWMIEKLGGIDARRRLPALAKRPYLRQIEIRDQKKRSKHSESATLAAVRQSERKPLVLFLDYFANYHDPQIVQAFEAVLRHHDIPYIVPVEQQGAGMMLVNVGDLPAARQQAENNLRVLGPYAREGHPIVCIEPSSAVCLSQEYPRLVDHPDVAALSKQVCEAGGFLLQLHQQGLLKTDFQELPATIGYHEPCHQRALGRGNPYHQLLPLIPQLTLHKIDKGCSGMAGTFGLSKRNFSRSVEIGAGLIEAVIEDDFTVAASECAACRLQMGHPRSKSVIHPIKLLAAAYRLIPLTEFRELQGVQSPDE